jgi:2,3-bisphosphoglycerate-dependent phosphoglycerate mutase
MSHLILLRHGQSIWNKKNLFTGWVDIPLSEEGIKEAYEAGRLIREIPVDCIFSSNLIRGIMTAMLAMLDHSSGNIPVVLHTEGGKMQEWSQCHNSKAAKNLVPVYLAWQLNERMYGELQGMNKQEMREKYGEEQVKIWRRSFDRAPPNGESLKMTAERTLPYFKNTILPLLEQGKHILISAHGNSLRSIVMHLDGLSSEEVVNLEIPTGKPLLYKVSKDKVSKI